MALTQRTTVTLYSGVDIDNDETLAFSSAQNREAYFEDHILEEHVKCSPIKKDRGVVKLDVDYQTINSANYMSFVNPDFEDKIYYCRIITDPQFNSKKSVSVSYLIDWWMTDMFTVQMDECYIERSGLSETDYQKSLNNPYDPSILEFRTVESLPISKDIEKPYYSFGDSNQYDGVYAGEAVCADNDIDNSMGILLIFSDVGVKNIDATSAAPYPSLPLFGAIEGLVFGDVGTYSNVKNNLCWYKYSTDMYEYRCTKYNVTPPQFGRGEEWNSATLGNLYPGSGNSIQAPVNYVYCDEMANSSEFPTEYNKMSRILGWFTDNNCLDNILGIYAVPKGLMMFSGSTYNVPIQVKMPTASGQNVVNKKLDLYPFAYYRLYSPGGDCRELRIEDFRSAQQGEPEQGDNQVYCRIGLSLDCVEKPNLLVAPKDYKASGASPHNLGVNLNSQEGLLFSQFAEMPYSIDAFRMAMAAQANAIIGNNTVQYEYDFAERMGSASKQIWGGMNALVAEELKGWSDSIHNAQTGDVVSEVGRQGMGMIFDAGGVTASAGAAGYLKQQNEMNMAEQAYDILAGGTDNAVYDNFKMARPAYASNQYHAMNMPSTNYNVNSFMDILIMKVSINPTILAQYDKYLTMYGMASGKCEIPKILNFVRGSGDNNILPHWYSLNGKDTCYIKTVNCKIIKSNMVSSAFIKQMFDNGVRFINGDELV